MIDESIRDARGGRLVFVSHCILNQNAKVRGLAGAQAAVMPVVELLLANGIGIYQMPCPEMSYLGAMRWGQVRDQYDSPMFRRACQVLAGPVLDQAEEYSRSGYRVLAFVMIDGSPVCGLNMTPQPVSGDQILGGMNWYLPSTHHIAEPGVYCRILQEEARQRQLGHIPLIGIPEVPEVGSFDDAMRTLQRVIADGGA
jgi:predicted secreted protein